MWVDMHRYFVEHNLPHEAIGDWLRSLIREELSR
jgi:uncharacterized protein YacL (UPF0231 family)